MENQIDIITATQKALKKTKYQEQDIPSMILKIIQSENWRDRKMEVLDDKHFDYFPDFVREPEPYGLDTDWIIIEKLIKGYPEVELAVAHVLILKQGRKTENEIGVVHSDLKIKRTQKQKHLQQLETHRPDLLEQVKKGELTVFKAMEEAGFSKHRIKITPEPELIAKTLKEKLNAEQIAELIKLLLS